VTWRKSANFTLTVTVRPKACAFSHQAQTSSAMACTPASISAGSVRSRAKVVSEPDDISYKDQELETTFAKHLGVPLLLANVTQQVYQMARAEGM